MRSSPVQLLESAFQKIYVEPRVFDTPPQDESVFDKMELQFFNDIEPYPGYWTDEKPPTQDVVDRTYVITLGVRTAETSQVGVYEFEFVVTGTVAVLGSIDGSKQTPKDFAKQYGLTLLFGMIRENLANITARMGPGLRLLPTVSFLEDSPREQKPADQAEPGAR